MTLSAFYDLLESHDWYHVMSDDHRVYRDGNAVESALRQQASCLGGEYLKLFNGFVDMRNGNSGKPGRAA